MMKKIYRKDWPFLEKSNSCVLKRELNLLISHSTFLKAFHGHLPTNMDDRWLILEEDGRFHFFRSWTGKCIAIINYFEEDRHIRLSEIMLDPDASSTLNSEQITNDIISVFEFHFGNVTGR